MVEKISGLLDPLFHDVSPINLDDSASCVGFAQLIISLLFVVACGAPAIRICGLLEVLHAVTGLANDVDDAILAVQLFAKRAVIKFCAAAY